MGKKITLTEAQFKDYLRFQQYILKEDIANEQDPNTKDIMYEDYIEWAKWMLENDFLIEAENDRIFNINALRLKGDVIADFLSDSMATLTYDENGEPEYINTTEKETHKKYKIKLN
jgi:hypothetical protein